jgi:hypothetical protein
MRFQRRICGIAAGLVAMAALGLGEVHAQPLTMERITGEGGRYSIDMPKGYTSTTSPRPDGGTMRQTSYLWKDSVGQYNVIAFAVIDPAPGTGRNFDIWEAQRQVMARYPGAFPSQYQEIQSGPAKGISFAMTVNSNRGQGVHKIAVKLYALDGRLYEMLSATRVEDRNDPTVAAFMNSLQIIR